MGLFSRLIGNAENPQPETKWVPVVTSSPTVQTYFGLIDMIRATQTTRDYARMLECCAQSLPLLPSLVLDTKKQFGAFDISSIPAIEVGCRYWAALQDGARLQQVDEVVNRVPALKDGWREVAEAAFADMKLAARIEECLAKTPGLLQTNLGKALGAPGRDTARIVATLTNLGRVVRTPSGKTYELRVASDQAVSGSASPAPGKGAAQQAVAADGRPQTAARR